MSAITKNAIRGVKAHKTLLPDIEHAATMHIHHETEPNLCGFWDIGRSLGYQVAKDGTVPTIRAGSRLLVNVPLLLKQMGLAD